jgi:lysophospholipase L1-like esterase
MKTCSIKGGRNNQEISLPVSFVFIIFLLSLFQNAAYGQTSRKLINPDIVYIGNSITQGVQLSNPNEEAPPATATKYVALQQIAGTVKFLNRGRSGFTTLDFLPTDDSGTLNQVIEASRKFHNNSQRLLVFSISLGTNDSAEKGPKGSPVDPVAYSENLKSIADKLMSEFSGCKIIFQQPIWYSPNTYNGAKYMAEGLARLQSYFPVLKSLVDKYSLSNPGQVFLGDTKAFSYFRKHYLTDLIPEKGNAGTFYLHPNKKGAEVLGNFWGKAIYKCLSKN